MAKVDFIIDLQAKIDELMELDYDVQAIFHVPSKKDATFGDKASSITAACLLIDIRNSSAMLQGYKKSYVANLLKSFHYICIKTIRENCGEVRSFNGDSSLAIFTESACCDNAVSSAFAIKYYMNLILKPKYKIANDLDYGVGIDYGSIFVVKVGISGEFNNDLVWIGAPVNNASKMGCKSKLPNNICISAEVFRKLSDNNKYNVPHDSDKLSVFVPLGFRTPIWKNGILPGLINPKPTPSAPIIPYFFGKILQPIASPDSAPLIYYSDYERPL